MPRPRQPAIPFRYFNSSPEIIRLVVMMYVRFPLSLRNVEDLLFERGIDLSQETVRYWWNRFGPLFAANILRQRVNRMRGIGHWRWHLDEMYVKVNGKIHTRNAAQQPWLSGNLSWNNAPALKDPIASSGERFALV
jgi:putative transposase